MLHGAEKPPLDTDVVFVELDPALHQLHYEVVSNEILWFLFHGLFDLIRNPTFDESFSRRVGRRTSPSTRRSPMR